MPPSLVNLLGRSYDDIAADLLEKWPDVFLKGLKAPLQDADRKKKVRSLAATIGLINKGEGTWWSKRPEATKRLAEVLRINPDDLHLDQKQGPHIFQFDDFRGLPSLDLKREVDWRTNEPRLKPEAEYVQRHYLENHETLDQWLSEDGYFPSQKMELLWVKDALEFDLLQRKLVVISHHDVLSCETLTKLFSQDNGRRLRTYKPLIITVQYVVTDEEIKKLIDFRQHYPLLVISKFEYPETSNDKELSVQPNYWILDRHLDWYKYLLTWVEERLNKYQVDTFFNSEYIHEWLEKFDPNHQWFTCTSDVLKLCELVSNQSEKKLKGFPVGKEGLGLFQLLFESQDSDYLLALALVKARWECFEVAWEGDLPEKNWKTLSAGICSLEKLGSAKLISKGENGWNFTHPFLARLALRDVLVEQVSKEPLTSWAQACFDSERRPLVDAVLDAVSTDSFISVAHKLEVEQDMMVKIGVAEALFMAVGRRLARLPGSAKLETIPRDVLTLIANHVVERLDMSQEFPLPWSRPVTTPSETIEWISSCLAVSLLSLGEAHPVTSSWLFPGWIANFPEKYPYQFLNCDAAFAKGESHWRGLLSIVDKWMMDKNELPVFPENSPVLFQKIGLIRRAATGAWSTDRSWWFGLIGTPWAEKAVLHELEILTNVSRKEMAMNWWPSLVKYYMNNTGYEIPWGSKYSYKNMSKSFIILEWIMKELEADSSRALDYLDDIERKFLIDYPQLLSASFKRELLNKSAKELPIKDLHFVSVPGFFNRFGKDVVDVLQNFLNDEKLGTQAAYALWNWAPEKAEHLIQYEKTLEVVGKRNLIKTCPLSSIGIAIDVLNNKEVIFNTTELNKWAMEKLSNSGFHASKLVKMIYISGGSGNGLDSQKNNPCQN